MSSAVSNSQGTAASQPKTNPEELFALFVQHFKGEGVEKNPAKAMEFLKQAADLGHPGAQFTYGLSLARSDDPGDIEKAVKYFKKAAEKGDGDALLALGNCYQQGMGVIKDEALAFTYYKQAAEKGLVGAIYNVGIFYRKGTGVKKDEQEALKYFHQAANQGYVAGNFQIGFAYEHALGVQKDMATAFKYYKLAADGKDDDAQCRMGFFYYEEGQHVKQNFSLAVQYFKLAAEQQNRTSERFLGICYHEGKGVKKDDALSKQYLQSALDHGEIQAEALLMTYFNIMPESWKEAAAIAEARKNNLPPPNKKPIPLKRTHVGLAFHLDDDDYIHQLLKTDQSGRLPAESAPRGELRNYESLKLYYDKRLYSAHLNRMKINEEIVNLIKLGNLHIDQDKLIIAALYFNGALQLNVKHLTNSSVEKYIYQQLATVEGNYFIKHGMINYDNTKPRILEYRKKLQDIRAEAKKGMDSNEPIEKIQNQFTKAIIDLIKELILSIQKELGKPTVKWACIGMGSMSRGEMCPNSDLEFVFIVDDLNSKVLDYFTKLTYILEMQIINLGETKHCIFPRHVDKERESLLPSGLSFDTGGNTPLGYGIDDKLIGTPKVIAQNLSHKKIDDRLILVNCLSNTSLIAGDEKLFQEYLAAADKAMAAPNPAGKSVRNSLVEILVKGHIEEFKPDLSKRKELDNVFKVKTELYRPFQEIMGCLSLYYNLKEKSTFRRIDELQKMGVFSASGANNLKRAILSVISLRFETQLFYKDEVEYLYHLPLEKDLVVFKDKENREEGGISLGSTKLIDRLYIEGKRVETLSEIYKVLIPFHQCAKEFSKTFNKSAFENKDFYDDNPAVQAIRNEKIFQHGKAKELYQQAVSLNALDRNAILNLARMEVEAARSLSKQADKEKALSEALKTFEKAVTIIMDQENQFDVDLGVCYNGIGTIHVELKEPKKALDDYQKALRIYINNFGERHPSVANCYRNIGDAYTLINEVDAAIEYYKKMQNIDPSITPGVTSPLFIETKTPEGPNASPAPSSKNIQEVSSVKEIETKLTAQEIEIRSIAFGKEQWITYFGDIGPNVPLPNNINEILNAPCPFWVGQKVKETHLLVLIPKSINGKLLILKDVQEMVLKPLTENATKFRYFFIGDENKNLHVEESYWVLMTRDIIPGSRHKKYDEHKKMVQKGGPDYQIPKMFESTVCILTEFFWKGTRLYQVQQKEEGKLTYDTFTRCQEKDKKRRMAVGKYGEDGLEISNDSGLDALYHIGTGAVRRLEAPPMAQKIKATIKAPTELLSVPIPKPIPKAVSPSLPPMAFGKAQWAKYFGDIGEEPPLPKNINEILDGFCPFTGNKVIESQVLVLIPKVINTWAVTISKFQEFIKKPLQGKGIQYRGYPEFLETLKTKFIFKPIKSSYWILMTKEVLKYTLDKEVKDQENTLEGKVKTFKVKYRMPKTLEAIIAIFTHNLVNNEQIYASTCTTCEERTDSPGKPHMIVGGHDSRGIIVQPIPNVGKDKGLGLAGVREL